MDDKDKKIEDFITELAILRQTVADLKAGIGEAESVDESPGRFQEATYSAVFNSANDAIFIQDLDTGQIIDVNKKACEMFCYSKDELLAFKIYDLSSDEPPFTHQEAAKLVNKTAGGEPQLFEWLAKDKFGRQFWVEINLKRAIIKGRYRLLSVVHDINERKQTERRWEEINKTLLEYTADPLENINRLTALCGRLLNADFALYNRLQNGMLYACGQWNVPPGFKGVDKPNGHICYGVINQDNGGIVVIRNLQETEYAKTDPNVNQFNLQAYIGCPVKFSDANIGSLCVVYSYDLIPTEEDKKVIGIIASAIAVEEERRHAKDELERRSERLEALLVEQKRIRQERELLNKELVKTNKKLNQLALKDPQTGLYNYRYLSEFIEQELYRAARCVHPLSIVMLDIDYFKSINDVYGHEFGDLVLKQLASYLKKMARQHDTVVRLSGVEFVIISRDVNRSKALMLAQRILDAVVLHNFGNATHIVKLKLSAGVASYPEDNAQKGVDLINLAYKILNKVKEDGAGRAYSSSSLLSKKEAFTKGAFPADVRALKEKIEKLTKKGRQNLMESIFAFAKAIELRDHYTGEHVENTVHYSTEIANELNLAREDIENVKQASILHDLGKVGISDKILLKKAKLTKKERSEIEKHPQIAADIIRPIQFMHDIIPLILYHHERWDGKGYPRGLKKEEIPIGARIIALADVYQALTSNRPYRKALSKEEAIKIIKKGEGTQFDPAIVKAFLKILNKEKSAFALKAV